MLNGISLNQTPDAVLSSLGEVLRDEADEKGGRTLVVSLGEGSDAYMAFRFSPPFEHNANFIQLSGSSAEMRPFQGLVLGDSADKVRQALGEPDTIRPVAGREGTMHWSWEGRNYSLQLTADALSSIAIFLVKPIFDYPDDDEGWQAFVAAAKAGDLDALMKRMMPDFEVFVGDEVLSVAAPYADFAEAAPERLREMLVGDDSPLRAALRDFEPEEQMRVSDVVGIGLVYKFPEGAPVQEIYLLPFGGEMKVWEIAVDFTIRDTLIVEAGEPKDE